MDDPQIYAISYTADGGRTIETWFVSEDQWQQVRDTLGPPDIEQIASAEIIQQATELTAQTVILDGGDSDG